MYKKILAPLLAVLLLALCACGGSPASQAPWERLYEQTGQLLQEQPAAQVGSVGGEWVIIGLSRSGLLSPQAAQTYLSQAEEYVLSVGSPRLHPAKSTDTSRTILGITAAGGDAGDVGGINLLAGLTDLNYITYQGINGPIWALVALDCGGYDLPPAAEGDTPVTRQALVDYLLSQQTPDGGWALAGSSADVDLTAMALTALAPYASADARVRQAVERALSRLSAMQEENGGFASWGTENSESCAQVVVALSALGIDAASDSRFVKSGNSALDALCTFGLDGGGLRHTAEETASNGMATEQGYYALTAYHRFLSGQPRLFDMSGGR